MFVGILLERRKQGIKILIVSIEAMIGHWTYHVVVTDLFGKTYTLTTGIISSHNELNTIRRFLEKGEHKEHAIWWKEKLNLIHQNISLAFGPNLRAWLKEYKAATKEENNGTN